MFLGEIFFSFIFLLRDVNVQSSFNILFVGIMFIRHPITM